MEISGSIKLITETQTFGEKGFRKREVVITTDEQYPQHLQLEFVQDKCDLLDKFQVGQNVTVGINLRGRSWTNKEGEEKYFNSIQGWNIKAGGAVPQATKTEMQPEVQLSASESEDLPF